MTRIAFLFLAALSASGQPLTFDVASVKPSPPAGDLLNINLGTLNHGVVTLANTTLSECVRYAYGLVSEDQIAGPDWVRDRSLRVDISAKTSPDATPEQVRAMMQTLLAERFHLEIHREPRPVRHFDLTVAKDGPKLRKSQIETPGSVLRGYNRGLLAYDHMPISTLAVLLSRQLRQPVVDLTGLTSFYDIHLEWRPDDPTNAKEQQLVDALHQEDKPLADIYKAIQAQLGLQLEPKKTPIEVIVIDHAEKVPIAN